ncbi:MAG TPA: glycosyl hydrolase [Puia sp.]|nr:glycosyl hydrolase [Puia sp.]
MKRAFYSTMLALLCLVQPAVSQLQWPAITSQTRPWTRWWWMGSAVNPQDLAANMEKYKDAGLGGLELTPIYGVKGYESVFIDYLSPRWMDRLSYTLSAARRLGLGLDMSTGTGWPFGGGPLIDSTYACKNFVYKSWVVKAGGTLGDDGSAGKDGAAGGGAVRFLQEALVHTDGSLKPAIGQLVEPVFANKDLQALALFQVRFEKWLPLQALMAYSTDGKILDLTGKVDAAGHLQWTAPSGGGDWNLYAVFQGWHGKMVERAAPGAEGNVIDHFSSAALKKYLSRFDTAFKGRNLSGLRAFFNDSYEVDDARGQSNWTPDFFALFRQYRGYDLREHLPALFGGDVKENNERVLCDYRETISDLLLDKFTRGWRRWAQGKGAVIRNQAHGSPANILDLYAASDIPETEGQDIYRYKFATSVAHTTGKKLVSSESVTWLNEHFLSTLADVKKALDGYLLGGVNHIFYHGTAYSPQSDPWPGWLFYASVHFTPDDPSWGSFGVLNQYVARSQSFLQQGVSDNDVLLYYPIYDSWSEPGHDLLKHYDRMEPEFSGTGFKANAETLQRLGYGYDYISDRQVQQTDAGAGVAAGSGAIRTSGGGLYQTLLLPDCRYISAGALRKLIGLAESGATILVYKELPSDIPGWGIQEARRNEFRQLLGRLHFAPAADGIQKAGIGKGAFLMGDDLAVLLAAAKVRRETMVEDSLEFVRRAYGQGNYYFIVNKSHNKWEGFVPLAADFRDAALFNPMDGRRGRAKMGGADVGKTGGMGKTDDRAGKTGSGGREVYLQLLPGESVIVETSHSALTSALYPYYRVAGEPVALKGEWKLDFIEGGPGLPASVRVSQLGSWTALDGDAVKSFSGTAKYTIMFEKPAAKARGWMLDLGKVDVTAQVFLNGNKIAMLIGPYYRVFIPAADIRAKNELEIRVSNGMENRIEDMDRRGVVWKKFYNYNFPAHVRENRNANGLFDAGAWKPFDSGLSGPVTLTAVEAGVPQGDGGDPAWTKEVGARVFPAATKSYTVNAYGAVGDGATLATHAIQSAIDDCAAKGGGVVMFEPGSYLSGALFVKEGVELRIDQGVELKGSQHFEDYPLIDTRIAGIEMKWPAALLNIIGVKKAAITGAGKVNAQGKFCWDKYWAMRKEYDPKGLRWIVDYDAQRVRTLLIQDAVDITIRNVRFVDAGFWTVQVLYSKYVTVDGIVVRNNEDGHGPSTDGVDIDSSSWVLVEHCDIDCNDDDFCLKAGRDWDGLRVDRPTEYVVIRNCTARKGGGLLTIGSETSGGIRHVLATDLTAKGTGNGFHIKSATTRGGTVEDIHIRNIRMDSVGNAILFTMNWNPAYSYSTLPKEYNPDSIPAHWKTMLHKVEPEERGIPHFKEIYVSGLKAANAKKAISATGLDGSLITGVHIANSEISAATAGAISYTKDWDFKNVIINTKDNTRIDIPKQ